MTTTHVDKSDERPYRRLVLTMLVGPLSWSLFFLVGYLVAEAACLSGLLQSTVAGLDLLVVVVVALGLVAALVSTASAIWAYRRWRAQRDAGDQGDELASFLALASLLLGALFTLAILTTALSFIFLEPCSWT